MLSLLHIENIAVAEKADIEFNAGFNVLTGETGAGKSIVIDAIGAVLGGRASRDLVRTGADFGVVTAVFSEFDAGDWFEQNGLEAQDELLLMRKITSDGKSSCRVNGAPVTVSQLRSLGERLLNIHGQHDGQMLLSESMHLKYLDSYGGYTDQLNAYKQCYEQYVRLRRQRDKLKAQEGDKSHRLQTLKTSIKELDGAAITPGEAERLSERRTVLISAEKLRDSINTAYDALYGGEDEIGASELIATAEESMAEAAETSGSFSELSDSVRNLRYIAEDVAQQLMEVRSSLDFTPGELEDIEERLSVINRLMKKYGGDEGELIALLERYKKQLGEISLSDEKLKELSQKLEESLKNLKSAAKELTQQREKAAQKLKERIISELEQLSMKGIQFAVLVEQKGKLDSSGGDDVKFLMSANAGEKLGRISKIASGGELARIMLAMKNVLAESEPIGTMVFDEVDTGVSGIAAQRVGEKLSDLAKRRQVLCVTHLPQIAAMANAHYAVGKTTSGGRTYTEVKLLDREGSKRELARLIGGENITNLTLNSAGELLDAAKAYREKVK